MCKFVKCFFKWYRQDGDYDFQITYIASHGDKYVVNILKMVCDCRKWLLIGLSWCHAISCMKHKHYNIFDYVPSHYKKEQYAACYSSMIYPAIKRQPGRP